MDGEIRSLPEVRISPWDQGFLFGATLFTTFPIDGEGRIPFWPEHQERLTTTAKSWNLPIPETFLLHQGNFRRRKTLRELLQKNELPHGAVGRYRLTPGEVGGGLPGNAPLSNPREILDIRPLPAPKPSVSLFLLSQKRNSPEEEVRSKNGSYLNTWLAHRELALLAEGKAAEGLMLDRRGNLTEGTVSNLYWIRTGKVETPSLSTGCLPGLTRSWLKDHCQTHGIPIVEGEWPLEHLFRDDLDSLFVSNCVQGLVPVEQILDPGGTVLRAFPGKLKNALYETLSTEYHKNRQQSLS
ncbi:MAG: aminotransferase class IV [Opitutales bacterium]|nr:aminotransferase class IV [Opitutales bacterium]